jgi:hypothetical protein
MSIDKPSGSGDNRPDQPQRPEHRPFPGQRDRPRPEPPPADNRSPAQFRRDRQSVTPREYAESKEKEAAARKAAADGTAGRDGVPGGQHGSGSRDHPGDAPAAGSRQDARNTGRPGRESRPSPPTAQREGTAPRNPPAQGDSSGPRPAVPQERGSAARPKTPVGRRPDAPAGPADARHRPFPGQRERPRPEPPPADNRSPAQLRRDRQSVTPREYAAFKEEQTIVREAAAKEPTARDSAGAAAQRGTGSGDQVRPGSDRTGENTPPGRDASGPAGKMSTARDTAHDLRPRPPAQHDSTSLADRDGTPEASRTLESPHPAGDTDTAHRPDAPGTQSASKGVITHMHSEVRGQKLDFYTDGTHWVSGDAVRAAQAEAERKPGMQRHDITGIPAMREQGRNIVGEKPDRSPGDTTDLPPTGEQLLEPDDGELPRPERLGRAIDRGFDDIKDSAINLATTMQELWDMPGTGGRAASVAISKGPEVSPVPYQSPDVGSIAELGVVAGVLAWHAYHRTRDAASELSDKISEWRDNRYAGN